MNEPNNSFVLSTETFEISGEDLNLDTDMKDVLTQLSSITDLNTVLGDPRYDEFERYTMNDNFGPGDLRLVNVNVYDNNLIAEAGLDSKHYSSDNIDNGLEEFKSIIKGRISEPMTSSEKESKAKEPESKMEIVDDIPETEAPKPKKRSKEEVENLQKMFYVIMNSYACGNVTYYKFYDEEEDEEVVMEETIIHNNEIIDKEIEEMSDEEIDGLFPEYEGIKELIIE